MPIRPYGLLKVRVIAAPIIEGTAAIIYEELNSSMLAMVTEPTITARPYAW